MRKTIGLLIFLLLVLALSSSPALAETMHYVVNSTYGPSIPTTPLTAPNTAFSFLFSEPIPLIPSASDASSFTTIVPVTYSSGATNATDWATIQFYSLAMAGLFDISLTDGGDLYLWSFFGPALFTGAPSNPVLLTGTFPIDADSAFRFNRDSFHQFGGGTVVATSIPEPSSLLLVGGGLLALAACARKLFR